MPLCRGLAFGSVLTRRARQLPYRLLVIQVLRPLTTYSSPARFAVVRIACRSVPQSGSVKPTPPRNSPVAKRGRNAAFCCSVPLRCTTMAMIRCELMMPLIDIHTAEMCSMIFA